MEKQYIEINKNNVEIIDKDIENTKEMYEHFLIDKPKIVNTDTETTGLHPIKDKPFYIIFSWYNPLKNYIIVYKFYVTNQNMHYYNQIIYNPCIKYHLGYNIKFDLNMLENIGINYHNLNNIIEVQAIPRLLYYCYDYPCDLSLKGFSSKVLNLNANILKEEVNEQIKALKADRIQKITYELQQETNSKWTVPKIKKLEYSILNDSEIPENILNIYNNLCKKYPEIGYQNVDKDLLSRYGTNDGVLPIALFLTYAGTLLNEKSPYYQKQVFLNESKLTKVLAFIEKSGVCIDYKYMMESKLKLEQTIKQFYKELWEILGVKLTSNQHVAIAKWFADNKTPLINPNTFKQDSSEKSFLYLIERLEKARPTIKDLNKLEKTLKACTLITRLKTAEKFYGTYLTAFFENMIYDYDKWFIHEGFNSLFVNTGRLSSRLQQFPKGKWVTNCWCKGYSNESCTIKEHIVYNPRSLFISRFKNGYLGFLDYSQIELRITTAVSIKIGVPDIGLIESFINYYNKENWTPIDMHEYSAIKIFNADKIKDPINFKKYRSIAKTANFAISYGSGVKGLSKLFNNDIKQTQEFYDKFKKTFPGFIAVQDYCKDTVTKYKKIKNDFGRIYQWKYEPSWKTFRHANSARIQGSGADFLKDRMIAVYEYIQNNNLQMKIINSIHDELQFDIPKEELHHLKIIAKIMEEQTVWKIPVACNIEISDTNWAEKREWKD